MTPQYRQKVINNLLRTLPREWSVRELADKFEVSELTIRRDLIGLANDGKLIRTYGGCIAQGDGISNSHYYKTLEHNLKKKKAIGREAAKLVKSGNTILLGDGSTTFQLACHLDDHGPITIYTNSFPAIKILKNHPNINLLVLGGRFDHESDMLLIKGSLSDRILETYHFDLVMIGTDAIDIEGNCLNNNEESACTYRLVLRRGKQKILLADNSKVNSSGHVTFGKLSDFDCWITTAGINKTVMKNFKQQTKIKEIKI